MKYLGNHSAGGFAPLLEGRSFPGVGCSVVGLLLIVLQLGSGTPLQRSFDQIQRSVTKPLPQAPPAAVSRPSDVYVPGRYIADPIDGRGILVPGHWDRPLPGGGYLTPPLTLCSAATGVCTTIPGGVRPGPEQRQTP